MKKELFLGILMVGLLTMNTKVIEATTTVSGTVSGTWAIVNSPYIVAGTVTVESGTTLIIEPGVTVKFATNTSLINYGTLIAVGTPNGTITFTANKSTDTAGYWNSIKFSGSQSKGTISYCLIEYGKQAVYLDNASKITITYNTIRNNKGGTDGVNGSGGIGAGIYLSSSTNNSVIGNTIYENQGGLGGTWGGSGARGGIGAGIYLSSSTNNTISGNAISNSRRGEMWPGSGGGESGGNYGNGYGVYIDTNSYNNIIDSANTYHGEPIHYYYGITTPTIIENQSLTLVGSGSTNIGRIVLIDCQNFIIRNNSIAGGMGENGHTGGDVGKVGAGIYLNSSTNITITNNTIYKNQGGQGGTGIEGGLGGHGGIGAGIYLTSDTNNITITDNNSYENQGGQGGRGGMYSSGSVGGIGVGIYLNSAINNTIRNNRCYKNQGGRFGDYGWWGSHGPGGIGAGMYFYSATNNIIENNTCYENQGGSGGTKYRTGPDAPGGIGAGIYLYSSINNRITGNTIYHNQGGQGGSNADWGTGGHAGIGSGIYAYSSSNNTIIGNILYENQGGQGGAVAAGTGSGIYLFSSDNNIINSNTIKGHQGGTGAPNGNGVGICCNSSIVSPLIYNNIYTNQTYNLSTDISPGTQTAEYNWWGSDPPNTSKFSGNIDYTPWLTGTYTPPPTRITLLTPIVGTVGTIVSVSGEGFAENELVKIGFGNNITITTITTDIVGRFNTTFTTDIQPYGSTAVRATGLSSGKTADGVFRILPCIVAISPWCGTVGTGVTVWGNGYGASETVIIHFGTIPSITAVMTSVAGNFVATFNVTTQPYGTTTIAAFGCNSGAAAYNTFRILPNVIFVAPSMGTVGSIVTVAGNGFGNLEVIRVGFGTTQTIMMVMTNLSGTFATTFTIDTQPCGNTTIAAMGMNSNVMALATFTIMSRVIMVTPRYGTVGSIVTVKGDGFGASELVMIAFGTTISLTTCSTSASGNFATTFTVNTQSYGTTTIRVRGLMTATEVMNRFFILPNIILISPITGTVGSSVTIAGNGFGKMEGIRVDFGTTANIGGVIMSSEDGTFSVLFMVDIQPYGTTSIVASGLMTASRDFDFFKIVPKITQVLPASGRIGTRVTVTGNDFGVTELIRIEFGNIPTITFTNTNGKGEFGVVFTVNSQPMGTTTIVAYGLVADATAMAYFVISPSTILKITPAIQNVAVGATFTAQVEVVNVGGLVTGDVYVSYNSNVLEAIGVGTGTFPPGCGAVSTITAGNISYSFWLMSGESSGSGTLCYLYFKAKSGGTSAVTINNSTQLLKIINEKPVEIPFTKEEAMYYVIGKIKVKPENKTVKADVSEAYQAIAECGSGLEVDVTSSTIFIQNSGGSFTSNIFLPKYIGTYTIQAEYLGFSGTTSVIIIPGTPTTLNSISGSGQVGTCEASLKNPFVVKVTDTYGNQCPGVMVNWQIISSPTGANGQFLFPTNTTTNIQGTASSLLTLGTEPPGTYTVYAISTGLTTGSPCTFTANSLRRFGTISGFCMLRLGTFILGTCSDITVSILGTNTSTTTDNKSYFVFGHLPVGSYTLNFNTWGASPVNLSDICISSTQFEDTIYIGTISLLAGDTDDNCNVDVADWGIFRPAWREKATVTHTNWDIYKEGDFNHDGLVDAKDFVVFRNNFGKQQQSEGRSRKSTPMSTKGKKVSSGNIGLSFNIDTLQGVDINDLRVGNIIHLKVFIRDAKDFLGGEIHLSFNPDVLEVIKAPPADKSIRIDRLALENDEVQIQPGAYFEGISVYEFINKVDNITGKIDYAVGVDEPQTREEGIFADIWFKIKTCGASSDVSFDFAPEENRKTVFVEEPKNEIIGQSVDVKSENVTIKVPLIFNDLDSARVHPNPARKGDTVKIGNLINNVVISLKIFNIVGELVLEKEEKSSNNTITWDLRNKDNEYVASGIYIYLLEYQGLTKKGKIGVIK